MKNSARPLRRVWLLGLLFVTGIASLYVLSIRIHIAPSGRFRVSDMGSEGDAFYEFTNGLAWLVVYKSANPADGALSEAVGSYYNKNGRWVLEAPGGKLSYLESTIWSIRSIETNGRVTAKFPRLWKW